MSYVEANKFAPWRKDLAIALASMVLGVLVVVATQPGLSGMGAGAIIILFGMVFLRRWSIRRRGKKIESRAIRGLNPPVGWLAKPNERLPSGEDLDLLLISPEGRRFAVEIKSHQSARIKRSLFGSGEWLTYPDGRKFTKDPIAQVLRAGEIARAEPVIWFPVSTRKFRSHLRSGVIVVGGGRLSLLKAVGAKPWWALI
jgi:hypothetical protein